MAPTSPELSLIIISHGQLHLVERALTSLARTPPRLPFEIVLLENVDGSPLPGEALGGMPVRLLRNPAPAGLARNLNYAFQRTLGDLLCIVNPDVVFLEDVISPLADLVRRGEADVAAPTIIDSHGRVLDSARTVPRPLELVGRWITLGMAASPKQRAGDSRPAWLAGTFLLMRRETFLALSGFDERYFLYFEDVEFGCRARLAGFQLLRSLALRLQHEPAHRSRSNPRYFAWHVASALRFFTSDTYRAALLWERSQTR